MHDEKAPQNKLGKPTTHSRHTASHVTGEISALADSLVQRMLACFDDSYGFSSASCQIYDTAWAAMIIKETDSKKRWLFPECFHYLLRNQADDGSWSIDVRSQTVGILNTSAALLALCRHAAEPLQISDYSENELAARIRLGALSLGTQLATWNDILTSNHIGVELIMPALLKYLQQADQSLCFDFKARKTLERMSAAKLSRFSPEMLYEQRPSSAVHSLEAFIGKIDFDKIRHHLFDGSMMASPSSTAAYLMHCSTWDEEAESYMRHVVKAGAGHGDGGVAGTFPIHYFEFNWVLATLLHAGFDISASDSPAVDKIRAIDVDDTAKGLWVLKNLGKDIDISPEVMIKIFEKEDAFATFGGERDRSLSSNCHVLLALLSWNDGLRHESQIRKAATFHLSHLYPTMLMVQAFTALLRNLDDSTTKFLTEELVLKVSIALFQACTRTLFEQQEDGSWEGSAEQTAYAILTLAEGRHLYFLGDLRSRMTQAIVKGAAFLDSCNPKLPERYWTSKTSYSVQFVFEAYVLAALKVSTTLENNKRDVGRFIGLGDRVSKLRSFTPLLQRTPLFSQVPEWQIWASLLESALFVPLLRARRLGVFPRDSINMTKDSYLDIIPFTWIGCNNLSKNFAPTTFMFDMMMISMLGFQTDEFMESVAASAFSHDPEGLHSLIDLATSKAAHHINKNSIRNGAHDVPDGEVYEPVFEPLYRFSLHVLGHESIRSASPEDNKRMERELKHYLHAHASQAEDNARFSRQLQDSRGQSYDSELPFFQWVRTLAADHVGVALPFAWACCWISSNFGSGADAFPSPLERYVVAAVERHLSTLCRMFNDLGSVARDKDEGNLNSICFPEFDKVHPNDLEAKKQALTSLAEYERSCLRQALDTLERAVGDAPDGNSEALFSQHKLGIIRYFCDVGELYNQLYVLRDFSATIVQQPGGLEVNKG
ncbi:ent-copalyl diphosphate/ent-kaurene synthase [Trichoderma asperellum]|nr:Ent-kaur-16-ene synthase [Trichoderma asperelloides]